MNRARPIFSVIVATRNRADLLAEALRSVAAQTFDDYECLVIDDGSDEPVRAQNAKLVESLGPRFRLIAARPAGSFGAGAAAARNAGLRFAQGTVVTFLDDDDYWIDPTHLSRAARLFAQPDVDLYLVNYRVHTAERVIVEDVLGWADWLRRRPFRDEACVFELDRNALGRLLQHRSPNPSTWLLRAAVAERCEGFYEWLRGWSEDFNLCCRAADGSRRILFCSLPVVSYRSPTGNAVSLQYGAMEQCFNEFGAAVHASIHCRDRSLRRVARAREAWTYRSLALLSKDCGHGRQALRFAAYALLAWPSFGALVFTGKLALQSLWAAVAGVGRTGKHARTDPQIPSLSPSASSGSGDSP